MRQRVVAKVYKVYQVHKVTSDSDQNSPSYHEGVHVVRGCQSTQYTPPLRLVLSCPLVRTREGVDGVIQS